MSKSVIRSAKPYWIYLILTGKKTVEVGKNFPKSKDWNKIVEMYCSKDMRSFNRIPEKDREWMRKYLGKVACKFTCDKIDEYSFMNITPYPDEEKTYNISDKNLHKTCLSFEELENYGDGKPLYGWHISDLVIYEKPRELREFIGWSRRELISDYRYLRRPFQSWGYVWSNELYSQNCIRKGIKCDCYNCPNTKCKYDSCIICYDGDEYWKCGRCKTKKEWTKND